MGRGYGGGRARQRGGRGDVQSPYGLQNASARQPAPITQSWNSFINSTPYPGSQAGNFAREDTTYEWDNRDLRNRSTNEPLYNTLPTRLTNSFINSHVDTPRTRIATESRNRSSMDLTHVVGVQDASHETDSSLLGMLHNLSQAQGVGDESVLGGLGLTTPTRIITTSTTTPTSTRVSWLDASHPPPTLFDYTNGSPASKPQTTSQTHNFTGSGQLLLGQPSQTGSPHTVSNTVTDNFARDNALPAKSFHSQDYRTWLPNRPPPGSLPANSFRSQDSRTWLPNKTPPVSTVGLSQPKGIPTQLPPLLTSLSGKPPLCTVSNSLPQYRPTPLSTTFVGQPPVLEYNHGTGQPQPRFPVLGAKSKNSGHNSQGFERSSETNSGFTLDSTKSNHNMTNTSSTITIDYVKFAEIMREQTQSILAATLASQAAPPEVQPHNTHTPAEQPPVSTTAFIPVQPVGPPVFTVGSNSAQPDHSLLQHPARSVHINEPPPISDTVKTSELDAVIAKLAKLLPSEKITRHSGSSSSSSYASGYDSSSGSNQSGTREHRRKHKKHRSLHTTLTSSRYQHDLRNTHLSQADITVLEQEGISRQELEQLQLLAQQRSSPSVLPQIPASQYVVNLNLESLKAFSGDMEDWEEFKSDFMAHAHAIPAPQRLSALKSKLDPMAKSLIAGYLGQDERTFVAAMAKLDACIWRPDCVVNILIQKIAGLVDNPPRNKHGGFIDWVSRIRSYHSRIMNLSPRRITSLNGVLAKFVSNMPRKPYDRCSSLMQSKPSRYTFTKCLEICEDHVDLLITQGANARAAGDDGFYGDRSDSERSAFGKAHFRNKTSSGKSFSKSNSDNFFSKSGSNFKNNRKWEAKVNSAAEEDVTSDTDVTAALSEADSNHASSVYKEGSGKTDRSRGKERAHVKGYSVSKDQASARRSRSHSLNRSRSSSQNRPWSARKYRCELCESNEHAPKDCQSEVQNFRELLKRKGLCWVCLHPGHISTYCPLLDFGLNADFTCQGVSCAPFPHCKRVCSEFQKS